MKTVDGVTCVDYSENYGEGLDLTGIGPFVLCSMCSGYRVEVTMQGHHCPVLPHSSIYSYCDTRNFLMRGSKHQVTETVRQLNYMVKNRKIVHLDKVWVINGRI